MKNNLNLKKVKLAEVKPYWRNPRINDQAVEAVMKSIKDYGYNNPIAVDKKMVIISGHTRFKALTRLGIEEIEVVILDLDPQKAKQYRIIDNKTSELAEWDMKTLIPELREIENIGELDIFFPDLNVEELVKESVGNVNFNPVTQEEIDKKEQEMKERFENSTNAREEAMMELTCPHCLETYHLKKSDILNAN